MEAILQITGVAILLIVFAAVAHVVAYLLTEFSNWKIPGKPFNCRACLTFWLTFLGVAAAAPEVAGWLVAEGITIGTGITVFAINLVGGLLGLANFFYVKSKTKIYD